MSSEELRAQVAAINPGDTVIAKKCSDHAGEWTVSGTVRERGDSLYVGTAHIRTRSDVPAVDLVAIVSHEPAKPPLPPEPKGDVVISTNAGWFFTPTERGWKRDDQIDNAMSWGAVAGQYPDFTVYRPEPSPERIEELVREFAEYVSSAMGHDGGWADTTTLRNIREFATRLLGGES